MSSITPHQNRPALNWGGILYVIDCNEGLAPICELVARDPELVPSNRVAQSVLAQLRSEVGFVETFMRRDIWDARFPHQGRMEGLFTAAESALALRNHPLLGRMIANFGLEQCEQVWTHLLHDPSVLANSEKSAALSKVLQTYYSLCFGVDIAGHCGRVMKNYLLNRASENTISNDCLADSIQFLADSHHDLNCLHLDDELLSVATRAETPPSPALSLEHRGTTPPGPQ
jgi:hypothetical protein